MFVIKRSGIKENVQFDKITSRLQKLLYGGLDKTIDPAIITQKICSRMSSGITTTELDNLASQICMGMIIDNPDFGILGARIVISNHQKNTDDDFLSVVTQLKNNKDIQGNLAPLVSDELYDIALNNTEFLQNMIDFERDYLLDFFGFKTLERSYLLKVNEGKVKRIVERPQHLFLRVAIGIHGYDFESVKKTYDNMSLKNYTHATPTLFNSGTNHPQLSSCFEKNTLINTLNGPIPIKDIKIGEEVITHLGNVKKVVQIHKNSINNRTLYNVEINKTNKFIVTEDHNLRVLDKNSKKIMWKSVNNLSSEDYVMIPKYSGHIDEHEIDVLQIVSKHKFDDITILCNDINDINYLSATELLLKVKERGFTGCDKLSKEKLLNKLISDKIEIEKVYEQYSLEGVLLNTYKNTDDIVSKLKISKRSISTATSNGKSKRETAGGYRWIKKEKEIIIPYIYQEINDKYIFTITKVSHSNLNNGQNVICYVKSSLLNRSIVVDENFCKFLGIWYGDGHIINKDGKISGIGITIHKDNKNLIEFCVSMKKHFGLEHVTIHKMTKQNVIQVLYHSSLLGILFKEKYGEHFDKKRLNKDIYKYTDKLVLSFLSGLITSDGCVTENGCITIELSNKTLINEIYSLCRIHNIDVSGVREINTNKLATTPSYSIRLTCIRDKIENLMKLYKDDRINNLKNPLKANNQHHCIEFNGFKFLKFNKKEKVLTKDLYVYTLGVEDDHSYSVEGIIAENCFLAGTEDSVEGIFETMTDCAKISKWSGGIGLHISNIRANGSYIRKTAGTSDGIVPMLKVYNDIARYINQGGGKRNGSFAVYLEPHHADVIPFLEARKNVGPEELRARDLFYALWVSDYFMECIEKNQEWYLMDPDQSYGLNEVYGDEYTELYKKYVSEGKYMKKIKARELWEHIIASQIEHGMPYISYKDHVNRKNNQKHYGTIKSSNLCIEVMQYSDKDETAVCNLGSICLPKILEYPFNDEWRNLSESKLVSVYEDSSRILKLYSTSDCDYCKLLKALLKSCGLSYIEIDEFEAETLRLKHNPESKPFETVPQLFSVNDEDIVYLGGYADNWKILSPRINYNKLYELAYELTVNLNKVIDINFYPTEKTRISNMKHRPIGLGVQGLADVFMTLKLPFTSDEAREINKEIFETIYFGSMSASIDLAKRDGRYPTYEGSPLSEGKFQYNLWGVKDVDLSGRWKWGELRNDLLKYGSRNSLNIALMPTASTASIFGNVESFEAITSNLYTRNVLSGVFTMINKYLIKDLMDLEIWNQDTKDRLIYNKGSVQNLKALPKFLREIYKTSFEIDQKLIIKMSAERGVFVCQSQSLNLFFDKPTFKELTASHFYGWKNGLKTGSYYIRTRSALSGQNFGLDPRKEKQLREEKINDVEDEGCLSCGA